jgi:hypothetical protein
MKNKWILGGVVLGVVILAIVAAGCTSSAEKAQNALESPIVVKAKTDPAADFSKYKTWSWVPLNPAAQIDPRLDDPEVKSMIRDAVEREMFTRGYERVDINGTPDLVLNVHFAFKDLDDKYIKEHYDGKYYPEYRTEVAGEKLSDTWTEGTLVFLLFDAGTRQAVWGGGGQAEVFPDLAPDVRKQRIDKAAKLIMESLPARR